MSKVYTHNNTHKLVSQLKRGDQEVYRKLCTQHFDQFYRYILNSVKSKRLAEQILEEAYIEIWQNRASLDVSVSFKDQLLKLVEASVFEILFNAGANEFLEDEIWQYIEKAQNTEAATADTDQDPILKVIQNNILQNQLLNELATTRR
ncbi:hypothetical protein FNH22_03805 [Fulvivirga sp. M361]|uniref:hypothetical protein n=1 Tax=Fulvivirga sp. M361 TaxID=2594266 RepID=UPI001179DB43|nr:hypothetical protein [Fulvivirga sp. M361]TRX61190.1 hypothetical protein FNH22_03805 [Fulvivirga sp. M361]